MKNKDKLSGATKKARKLVPLDTAELSRAHGGLTLSLAESLKRTAILRPLPFRLRIPLVLGTKG